MEASTLELAASVVLGFIGISGLFGGIKVRKDIRKQEGLGRVRIILLVTAAAGTRTTDTGDSPCGKRTVSKLVLGWRFLKLMPRTPGRWLCRSSLLLKRPSSGAIIPLKPEYGAGTGGLQSRAHDWS